ncbi:aldo/keto reductase [Streptomyces parvulus]|uniref:aldo/keto reductase n=1 Tax=Streptomyces parvulus TaxID=146923 RepID=UPI003432162F
MEQRRIGTIEVSAVGLGAMPLSIEGRPDDARSLATVHAALDAGATLIDTADAYHVGADTAGRDETGHNEDLIARALRSWKGDSSEVLIATKGGHVRGADGSWGFNGRPEHLKRAARASAARLGTDALGLYHLHRPDPDVPFEESVGALAELLDEGVIRMAGVSNVDPSQIRQADDILGGRLATVQNEFSPASPAAKPELDLCAELGIAFLPWSPLGGTSRAGGLASQFSAFAEVARRHGVSPQRVCLAWELSLSATVIPIPGSTRPESIVDSLRAPELDLTADDLAELSSAVWS